MGDMPLVCHQATVTPPALEFMHLAGLSPPKNLLPYSTGSEAIALARQRIELGERLVFIYPPLPGVGTADELLVPVTAYGVFNDKRRIPEFVDEKYLPKRQIISRQKFTELKDLLPEQPVFVKAGVEGASGAGQDVRYCPDESAWQEAIQFYHERKDDLSGLVIEEAISVSTCWCLGVTILDDGCHYLGGAIQLFDKPAKQTGNRIDPDFPVPDEAIQIAIVIAEEAMRRGYRGVAGFDIGIDANNKLFVFDLNFRLNSCTSQLMIYDHVTQRTGARVSQSWQIEKTGSISNLLERLAPFAEAGVFIPFRMFDQETYNACCPGIEAQSVVTGVIVAESVVEIESLDATMKQALV